MVDPYLKDAGAALLPDGQVLYAGGNRTFCQDEYCQEIDHAEAELYTP
jgi:hypothetical protein